MAQIHLKVVGYLDTKLKGTQIHKHMKVLNTELAPNVRVFRVSGAVHFVGSPQGCAQKDMDEY